MESEHGMGGAAVGDLDPDSPGNEVVAVTSIGEVWMARQNQGEWHADRIYTGPGEMIMCAIADVDPRFPGNEFVGVGMVSGEESLQGPGQVLVLRRDGDRWAPQQAFQDTHMIHGVAVGDVSSRAGGNEIVACGFNHRVTLLSFDGTGWRSEVIYVGNDRMKIAAIADVLPQRDGLEILVAGSDGTAVLIWEGRLGWHHQTINADVAGQSRIAFGEHGVLIGGDKGKITLAVHGDGQWRSETVARDSAKVRGVAVADVDTRVPGAELYVGGYSRNILQIVQDQDGYWHSRVVFRADRPLHHLVAGDIDPHRPGLELVTCGHAGQLILLHPPAVIPAQRKP